jgi:hypothetical protein
MVIDQTLDARAVAGMPSWRIRAAALSMFAVLALVSAALLYRSTIGHPAMSPVLRGMSCRWQGDRVSISGVAYNPNASPQTITIDRITAVLAGGVRVELVNSYSPPQLDRLAARGSVAWATSARPGVTTPMVGQPIVGCTAQAANWVRSD